MRYVKAFGQFWYEFIIGDDWKIAAAVVCALIGVWGLMHTHLADEVVTACGATLVLALFVGALAVDLRRP